jgi:hypothetical protein
MQGAYTYTKEDLNPSTAAVKKMTNILIDYGDAINAQPPSENEVNGYATASLLFEALKVGGVNPTDKAIQKGMNHLSNWDGVGIYGHGIDFTKEHTTNAPTLLGNCLWFYQVRGTKFVPVGQNPICTPTVRLSY